MSERGKGVPESVEAWKEKHLLDVQPWIRHGGLHQDFEGFVPEESYYWRVTHRDDSVTYQYEVNGRENEFPIEKVRNGDVLDIYWIPKVSGQPAIGLSYKDSRYDVVGTGAVRKHARKVPVESGGVIRDMTVFCLQRRDTRSGEELLVGVAPSGKVLSASHTGFPIQAVFEEQGLRGDPL